MLEGKNQFDPIETHIFDDLDAFDLNSEVKLIIKEKIGQI